LQETLDIRAAVTGGLHALDFCELGTDFRPLAGPLACCRAAPLAIAPYGTAASAHELAVADVLDQARWESQLAFCLENDLISLEKERKEGRDFNCAMQDANKVTELLRLVYRRLEEARAASAAAVQQHCCDSYPNGLSDKQRCISSYISKVVSFTRGCARVQLYYMHARYRGAS
jgi:hypothetical protein